MGKEIELSWKDRMNTLDMRTARGTQRYASKDDTLDKPEKRLDNEDENIEGHGEIQEGKEFQNEDEASQEEHEIQMSEVERKKEMQIQGKKNTVIVKIANARYEEVPAKRLKVGDHILYLGKEFKVSSIKRMGQGALALDLGTRMLEYESDEMVQLVTGY